MRNDPDPKSFFESPRYRDELHALARLCVRQKNASEKALDLLTEIKVFWDPENGITGYTQEQVKGYLICLNAGYSGYADLEKSVPPELKFKANYALATGLFAHELGHFLKSSFTLLQMLKNQKDLPNLNTKEWDDVVKNVLPDPSLNESFLSIFRDFFNYLEDGYVERFVLATFSGRISKYLAYRRAFKREAFLNQRSEIEDEGSDFEIVRYSVLLYSLFGISPVQTRVKALFDQFHLKDQIEEFLQIDFSERRNLQGLKIFMSLYPLWIEDVKKGKMSSPTPQQENSSSKGIPDNGAAPMDGLRPTAPQKAELRSQNSKDSDSKVPKSLDLLKQLVATINCDIEKVERSQTQQNTGSDSDSDAQQQDMELAHTLSKISPDCEVGMSFVDPQSAASQQMSDEYFRICNKYESQISQIVEEVKPLLEYYKGKQRRNLYSGDRFRSTDAFKLDGRCFSSRKLPKAEGKLAVILLVDMSGSMGSDDRYRYAQEAGVVLSEFLSNCNVPYMVVGHTADCSESVVGMTQPNISKTRGSVALFEFHNWTTENPYAVSSITACPSDNRDGVPLRFAIEKIKGRREPNKLILSLSDGMPNADHYRGESAANDVREAVSYGEKNDIKILPVAIGQDKTKVNALYREQFIDITKLEDLPVQIISFLTRYL